MDTARPAPRPIGWTELLAGITALVFAAAAGGWLVTAMAGPVAGVSQALSQDGTGGRSGTCAGTPASILAIRLGRSRVYAPPVNITLDPPPFGVSPAIGGDQAYAASGLRLSGCRSEELLAYYTAASPTFDRVLAWTFVSTNDCPSAFPRSTSDALGPAAVQRQCVSVTAIDANTGAPMGTRMFLQPR